MSPKAAMPHSTLSRHGHAGGRQRDEAAPIGAAAPARNKEQRRERRGIDEETEPKPGGIEFVAGLQRRKQASQAGASALPAMQRRCGKKGGSARPPPSGLRSGRLPRQG